MSTEPDWVVDMMAPHALLVCDLYDSLKARGIQFDGAWLSDDLGYRSAPIISPPCIPNWSNRTIDGSASIRLKMACP